MIVKFSIASLLSKLRMECTSEDQGYPRIINFGAFFTNKQAILELNHAWPLSKISCNFFYFAG